MTNMRTMGSPNRNIGRSGHTPDMDVLHTTGNTTQSAINTTMNRNNQVSYHYIIAGANFAGHGIVPAYKDGDIFQMVEITNAAWHAGITEAVRNSAAFKRDAHPMVRGRTHNPNQYTVGIGFGDMNMNGWRLTEKQIASYVGLAAYLNKERQRLYGYTMPLTRDHIVGHNEINPVNRPNCPGNIQWNLIIAGLLASNRNDDMITLRIPEQVVQIPARLEHGRWVTDLPPITGTGSAAWEALSSTPIRVIANLFGNGLTENRSERELVFTRPN